MKDYFFTSFKTIYQSCTNVISLNQFNDNDNDSDSNDNIINLYKDILSKLDSFLSQEITNNISIKHLLPFYINQI